MYVPDTPLSYSPEFTNETELSLSITYRLKFGGLSLKLALHISEILKTEYISEKEIKNTRNCQLNEYGILQ